VRVELLVFALVPALGALAALPIALVSHQIAPPWTPVPQLLALVAEQLDAPPVLGLADGLITHELALVELPVAELELAVRAELLVLALGALELEPLVFALVPALGVLEEHQLLPELVEALGN
jgi:hypothetical protein